MDKESFIGIFKQYFPFGDPEQYANYAFSAFDLDKSGRIDFREFIMSLSISTKGDVEDKLKCIFYFIL